MKDMSKEIEIESDIPIPPGIKELAETEPNVSENIDIEKMVDALPPAPTTSPEEELLRKENELLKAKLENAELRVKLAEASSHTPTPTTPEGVKVGRPLPKPEEIPQGLPPMPAADPLMGDKTPALVEWFRDHWPEEFAIRYKGRKTHLKEKLATRAIAADDDREEAKAPTFQPSAADGSIDTSPRLY